MKVAYKQFSEKPSCGFLYAKAFKNTLAYPQGRMIPMF